MIQTLNKTLFKRNVFRMFKAIEKNLPLCFEIFTSIIIYINAK